MKKVIIIAVAVILATAGTWKYYNTQYSIHFGKWHQTAGSSSGLPWIPFMWSGLNLGDRYFDKAAMFVPVSIDGISSQFQCQLDIGANLTMLYGNDVAALSLKYPSFREKLRQRVIGKDTFQYLQALRIKIGDVTFESPQVNVYRNYGEQVPLDSLLSGTHKIGTIGVDIGRDRLFVIDYPQKRLCVIDDLPKGIHVEWSPITLDDGGRVILPMEYKGKRYKVMYDCGSSIFSLLASHHTVEQLTSAAPTDTIGIPSWGNTLQVLGRRMSDSFTLAGRKYGDINVYSNGGPEEIVPEGVDAVTGNALFLDKVIVIDFKHKRFGVVR
jgi:hypothetical protein